MQPRFLVGIDEVGRGPVAGPVYVCAVLARADEIEEIVASVKLPIRDSKKLTHKMREKWFLHLQKLAKNKQIRYIISKCSNKEIDEKGIAVCIRACIENCLEKLKLEKSETLVLLDGGLKTKQNFKQKTIIKGDESEPIISLASIIAKVSRDAEMDELAKQFPKYLWEKNKGYGTKMHLDAIRKNGISVLHRKSFLKNVVK